MNARMLAATGAATVGAATAVTALLLGSTVAVAEAPPAAGHEVAYALAAAGLLTIDPIPYAESVNGEPVEEELARLGSPDGISARLLTAAARRGLAESSVVELDALGLVRADLVRTYCEDGRGGLEIIGGTVLGKPLPSNPVPGQTLDLSPLVRVRLAHETRNPDGSLTVTGIEVSVLPGAEHDLDESLNREGRTALPGVGRLGNADLAGAGTVGAVVDGLSGALGSDLNLSAAVQTITIGSATCGGPAPTQPSTDKGWDKGRDKGWDKSVDEGRDKDWDPPAADDGPADEVTVSEDQPAGDIPQAPAPELVRARLPVTG